jgi:hypothetical protein
MQLVEFFVGIVFSDAKMSCGYKSFIYLFNKKGLGGLAGLFLGI